MCIRDRCSTSGRPLYRTTNVPRPAAFPEGVEKENRPAARQPSCQSAAAKSPAMAFLDSSNRPAVDGKNVAFGSLYDHKPSGEKMIDALNSILATNPAHASGLERLLVGLQKIRPEQWEAVVNSAVEAMRASENSDANS